MIEVNSAQIYAESFGDPADPPILLVMGAGASMLDWDAELCQRCGGAGVSAT